MGKQIIVKTLLLFVMLGYGLASQAQVQVSARTDTDRIRIGEQVKLILSATVPNQGAGNVVFPQLPDSFTHWEVVSRTGLDTAAANGNKVLQQTLVLTSFDSGSWDLPALKFEVLNNGAVTDSAFTDSLRIEVGTVQVDTTKAFKPIKAVRTVPWSFWDYWLYFAIGITVIIIGIGLWVYFRGRPKKEVVKPAVAAVPPYEVALLALKQLKEEKLWQQGDVKQYYTRITDVLRAYFEQQFNIPALEQTSEELLQHIKPVTVLNQQRDRLRDLLTIADLAKFAKLNPTPEEHERALSQAFEIVEWTKPAVEKAKEAEKEKSEGVGN
ncbi:hypothetical protein [Chitinophaga sp.]|uniref:hypothetical protein n=1 Tax=Chitinophaga sp. TaxID=1869181 RepID=UPI0031E032F8